MRPFPGKDIAIILDHVGNVEPLGHPLIARKWQLDGGKKDRNAAIRAEDSAGAFRQCLACFSWQDSAANRCPECGEAFKINSGRKPGKVNKNSKLVLISPEQADNLERSTGSERRIMIGRAKTKAELEAIAKRFGYARGWIYITAKRKGIK